MTTQRTGITGPVNQRAFPKRQHGGGDHTEAAVVDETEHGRAQPGEVAGLVGTQALQLVRRALLGELVPAVQIVEVRHESGHATHLRPIHDALSPTPTRT